MNVLYLSYDGALDPLGRSQVVPYLERLAALGHHFDLFSFEKSERRAQAPEMRSRLSAAGIDWHPLPYTKRPPVLSTAWDLARGVVRTRKFGASIDLVHSRSYPCALIARRLKRRARVPFLFDMRGLYADERVEGGWWKPGGRLYRVAKDLEASFLREADGVVTLTEASRPVVERLVADAGGHAPVRVIPTAVDLERFRPLPVAEGPFTLAYVGSIGTVYLLDEMLAFARVLTERVDDSRLLLLLNGEWDRARRAAVGVGLDMSRVEITSALYEDVPGALASASATFAFIRPTFSKVASAATKFAESLALGLPTVVNRGIGDAATIVESSATGAIVDPYDPATFSSAIDEIAALANDPATRARCRQVAEERFGLAEAVAAYDGLYRHIAEA